MSTDGGVPLQVRSMFGHRTRRGLVILTLKDVSIQVRPADARDLAQALIECAAAAESDECLDVYLATLGMEEPERAAMMGGLRGVRADLEIRHRTERVAEEWHHEL
jgi:hypothetical protein